MQLTELRRALFQKLRSVLSVPVYEGVLSATTTFPCVRYTFLAMRAWPSFLSGSGFSNTILLVEAFSKAPVMTEAEGILKQVIEALDRWECTFPGGKAGFGFLSLNRRYEEDDNVWVLTAEFSVHLLAE